MPKFATLSSDNANIWLWQLTESPEQLLALLATHPDYAPQAQSFRSTQRQREWLATRALLHNVLGDDIRIAYDKDGAPRLVNINQEQISQDSSYMQDDEQGLPAISISHSHQWVAIALATSQKSIGLDLEIVSEKAGRVQHKFLTQEEQLIISPTLSPTDLWCAKEATYKLCNHSGLLFLEEMRLYTKEEQLLMELPTLQRTASIEIGEFEDCAFALAKFVE